MECGYCIFERLRNEGMWDRFGTTFEQELEASCDKHLLEQLNTFTKMATWKGSEYLENEATTAKQLVAKIQAEIEKRLRFKLKRND